MTLTATQYQELRYNEQQKLEIIYDKINKTKLPYKYFKKFNLISMDVIEKHIDKYFDIKTLLLENFRNIKHISLNIYENIQVFWKYTLPKNILFKISQHHNIPLEFLNNDTITTGILNNFIYYQQLIPNNTIKEWKNKLYDKIEDTIEDITENMLDYDKKIRCIEYGKIPIDKFPINCKLCLNCAPGSVSPDHAGMKIIKICKKIVKYENRFNPVVRQIKITTLQQILDRHNYYLYIIDNSYNIRRYFMDEEGKIYLD